MGCPPPWGGRRPPLASRLAAGRSPVVWPCGRSSAAAARPHRTSCERRGRPARGRTQDGQVARRRGAVQTSRDSRPSDRPTLGRCRTRPSRPCVQPSRACMRPGPYPGERPRPEPDEPRASLALHHWAELVRPGSRRVVRCRRAPWFVYLTCESGAAAGPRPPPTPRPLARSLIEGHRAVPHRGLAHVAPSTSDARGRTDPSGGRTAVCVATKYVGPGVC